MKQRLQSLAALGLLVLALLGALFSRRLRDALAMADGERWDEV